MEMNGTMMYEQVLVAIDESEISRLALQEAIGLATRLGARLCIAHGIDAVTANAYNLADRDSFLASKTQTGRAMLERAEAAAGEAGVRTEKRLLEVDAIGRSRLPEVIVKAADDWEANLIVIGTHGRRGMSHLLLGSVAEGIVHIASRPVLVVPGRSASVPGASERTYANLMVAVDGSSTSAPALQEAIDFARHMGSALRVVYAADTANGATDKAAINGSRAEEILEAAREKAGAAGLEVQTSTLESSRQASAIADAVAADATAWPAHLIVLGTHGRQGLERLRMGSVAEAILRVSPTPVLLVRTVASPVDRRQTDDLRNGG
jgi:nucleotide-binding universal stress UspA family protein